MQAKKQESLFFVGMLLLGIGLMAATFGEDFDSLKSTERYSSAMYPRLVLSGWLLTASLSLYRSLRRLDETGSLIWGKAIPGLLMLVVYVALLKPFGFLIPSICFCLSIAWFLGYRKPIPLLLAGVLFPIGLDYLFNEVLMILLPANPYFLGE